MSRSDTAPTIAAPATTGLIGKSPEAEGSPRRRFRIGIVVVLVVSLLASAGARQWAMALQRNAYESSPYATAGSGEESFQATALGSLDSYLLILMLGGLRGPLVMYLWSRVENQKNDRSLADVDTMIELIRLLQPEFDSVHIFQAWNKAYNISSQIANLPTRYAVIMDAVRYLEQVDRGRPNNLNILMSLNLMFQHKLGSTTGDSIYYRKQVREDSMARPSQDRLVGAFEQRMQPILDEQGNVLPELSKAQTPRPADLPTRILLSKAAQDEVMQAAQKAGVTLPAEAFTAPTAGDSELMVTVPEGDARKLEPLLKDEFGVLFVYADWNTGATMQYLDNYGPFPYGVSPLGIGFNYLKRAQVVMNLTQQRPAQGGGPSIIDSRPAVELRGWTEAEWEDGVEAEAVAFGRQVVPARLAKFEKTADVRPDEQPQDAAKLAEARFEIELATELAHDSRAEFQRHLMGPHAQTLGRVGRFAAQIEEVEAKEKMARADLAYLDAVSSSGDQKVELLRKARGLYADALARFRYLDLRYYLPGAVEEAIFTPEVTGNDQVNRSNLQSYVNDQELIAKLYKAAEEKLQSDAIKQIDETADQREQGASFRIRAEKRIELINAYLNEGGSTTRAGDTQPAVTQPTDTAPANAAP